MVGAYTTYVVQEAIRAAAPGLLDLYILIAIPIAFGVTALVGVVMEMTVIRHLYRRPLMTLLATWAISLLLINLVRVGFGTQNLEFVTPGFLSASRRRVCRRSGLSSQDR
jgi:urea transport system permease protein